MPAKPDDQLAFDSLDESVKWPQRLVELSDVIEAELLRSRQKGHSVREQSDACVAAIARYFGGRPVYLPKGDALERAMNHRRMWKEFTGDNHEQLAQRFNYSVPHVYEILAQQRRLHSNRIQSGLFADLIG